jgi:hypothetical protein
VPRERSIRSKAQPPPSSTTLRIAATEASGVSQRVDFAVIHTIGVHEIELASNETDLTITAIPFALHRDFQQTSHSHERDIEGCQEALAASRRYGSRMTSSTIRGRLL